MTRKGNYSESAVVDSLFISLKKERIKKRIYPNCDVALADIADHIDTFYSRARRHSHFRRVSPEQFEAKQKRLAMLAACSPAERTADRRVTANQRTKQSGTTLPDAATAATRSAGVIAVSLELSAVSLGTLEISVCDDASVLESEVADRMRQSPRPFPERRLAPCAPYMPAAEGKIVIRSVTCSRTCCVVDGEHHQYSSRWTVKAVTSLSLLLPTSGPATMTSCARITATASIFPARITTSVFARRLA